ncbi:hypothetical protein [Streptomyces sp. NPDC058739]|uniref:VHL beta domain-containing protein n=1 Tax=Streptomyces sp. NPDC058739 TaxID=3346618 RepID=UPI0036AAB3F6
MKDDVSTLIEFVNVSGTRVHVLWVDYEKRLVLYRTLEPGESYVQQTFVTHPWRIESDSGYVHGVYLPSGSPARAVLR